jgi:hypothetical protein
MLHKYPHSHPHAYAHAHAHPHAHAHAHPHPHRHPHQHRRSNKNRFRQSQSKIFEGLLTLSLCKNLYIDSSILKCEKIVPGVSYCSTKEKITNASVCRNEEKATALIYRILNTVTTFGSSKLKSTSYKPQNRTGYPSLAIITSIIVIPLTFVLLMYAFFLKVHLGEWKRPNLFKWLFPKLEWLSLKLYKVYSASGVRNSARGSNFNNFSSTAHLSRSPLKVTTNGGTAAHSNTNYVQMNDVIFLATQKANPRSPTTR